VGFDFVSTASRIFRASWIAAIATSVGSLAFLGVFAMSFAASLST
jgi:hypothetical protein